ncbi:MAG: hypothetical protein EOP14_03485 [Pseudomonas sp.]|nr:MAG: hypothetical protein EOP14_03485 [Pseudomonas sp.]
MRSLLFVSILTLVFAQTASADFGEPGGPHTSPGIWTSDEDLAKMLPPSPEANAQKPGATNQVSAVSIDEIEDLGRTCTEARTKAGRACNDPLSTDGMSKAGATTMAEKMMLIGQLGQLAASATGNSKICTLAAGLSGAAQVVSMIKGQACSGTQSNCSNSCDQSYDAAVTFDRTTQRQITSTSDQLIIKQLQGYQDRAEVVRRDSLKYRSSCNGMAVQAGQAMLQAVMLSQSLQQAAQCAKDTSTASNAYATPSPLNLGASATDCSNASFAATSMACICKSTPSDPMCGQFNGGVPGAGGGGGVVGGSVTTPGMSAEEATDGQVVDPAPKFEGKGGSHTAGSGGGGGGLGSGGGGGALGGGDGEGGGGSGLDKNVITGTSGSGGGVAGLSAGSGGGGGGGSRGAGSGGGAGSGFDFKKYLPKSLFKNRGLAGMTVPSTDGITGPMGPSIWEKVSNRYQVKKSTLIQDK